MATLDTHTANSCSEYIGVRLLEAPYHLDRVYEYKVPDACRESIKVGSFVILPYGNGNRRVVAVVVYFTDTPAYDEDKIKRIDAPAADSFALSKEQLGLSEFISRRCLCTFGDAAKLMLPPGALGRLRESYRITPKGETRGAEGTPPEHADMLVFLQSRRTVSGDALRLKYPANCVQTLAFLQEKGLVEKIYEVADRKDAYRTVCRIAVSKEEAEAILSDIRAKGRAPKQRDVLSVLIAEGETDVQTLSEKVPSAKSALDALIKKGVVEQERIKAERKTPFSDQVSSQKPRELKLNEKQTEAYNTLEALYASGKPAASLLFGVTGSGKTSVMLAMIDRVIADGKSVIVLLPEIALTPQTYAVFASRYEGRIALIHSGLTPTERYDAYESIKAGEVSVVIGTRSAVFAPLKNLGMIIIDEEHEHTYKSDMTPRYHTRDVAKFRCAHNNALLIMASATPDVETYYYAKEGRYHLVELPERYGGATLPEVQIVDMKGESRSGNINPVSRELLLHMQERLDKKEQSVIFINRRGFNNYVVCAECGESIRCPNCDVSLTYHTKKNDYGSGELRCHWCGFRTGESVKCDSCGSERFLRFGYGTQRVEKEIFDVFPNASVIRMDMDTIENKNTYYEKLNAFRRGEADVLLGTSMITKGHDFPNVTLVGVLMADAAMTLDDYRAGERTYATITQVVGRAGRAEKKGLAVIQAMNPQSEIIKLACSQDYKKFYESEIEYRKAANFPPFCDIALLDFVSEKEAMLLDYATRMREKISSLTKEKYKDMPLIVYGPYEAPVYRVEGRYRIRIIVKCRLNNESRAFFDELMRDHSSSALAGKPTMTLNFSPTSI